jgi:peroxiredoxin
MLVLDTPGMEPRPSLVGRQAPKLELPDVNGQLVRLVDLRGRAVLVVFLRHAG